MTAHDQRHERNRLLAALPQDDYDWLAPHARPVRLAARQLLMRPEEPIRQVYFPQDAVASLLVVMEDGTTVEAATIGNEGMIGLPVFLGDHTSTDEVVVQIAGDAAQVPADVFQQAALRSTALRHVFNRYTLAQMAQLARTAGCNRVHPVDERCARWLLMSHDRVGRDEFPLTQEFLAAMLGVRRPSVTTAAGMLQAAGLISYRRGRVVILDRERLESAACEDYRLTRDAYVRLFDGLADAR